MKCIAVLFRTRTLKLKTSHAVEPLFSIRTLNRLGGTHLNALPYYFNYNEKRKLISLRSTKNYLISA